jgi:hypothetical protein
MHIFLIYGLFPDICSRNRIYALLQEESTYPVRSLFVHVGGSSGKGKRKHRQHRVY